MCERITFPIRKAVLPPTVLLQWFRVEYLIELSRLNPYAAFILITF